MITIPTIYMWSIGSALFALVGMLIAHRLIKPIDLDKHQPSLDATLNIVGTLVSILLGLLVAASLANYQSLQTAVDAEASSVSDVCRLTFGLPPTQQREVLKECLLYCDQVVNDEWPEMMHGHSSQKALGTYVKLLKSIVTLKPSDNGQTNVQNALITAVQTLGDYRRGRVLWIHNRWTKNLMPVLIMCSMIVLIFAYLYVKRGSILLHGFLICFVATALGANLGLIHVLNHPFSGDWTIRPTGFEFNAQLIRQFSDVR